jgi:hypothetical protein
MQLIKGEINYLKLLFEVIAINLLINKSITG